MRVLPAVFLSIHFGNATVCGICGSCNHTSKYTRSSFHISVDYHAQPITGLAYEVTMYM